MCLLVLEMKCTGGQEWLCTVLLWLPIQGAKEHGNGWIVIICTNCLIPEYFHLTVIMPVTSNQRSGHVFMSVLACMCACVRTHMCVCVCKAKILQGCPETKEKVWICWHTLEQILVGLWSELYHSELLRELPLAVNCLPSKILFSVKIFVLC
jgi:hypothetical protein